MWSTTVDPDLRILPPENLPLAIIVISCIFVVFSVICVGLRTRVRLAEGTFGLDDALMAAGTVSYVVVVGLAVYGCFIGLGTLEEKLNQWLWSEALKIYIVWILNYVVALALVKSSVCLTIQRIITTDRGLKITVWVLLGLTWASFFITFVGTLLYCRPVQALWTPQMILAGEGTCADVDVLIALGHVATSSAIVTDLALVVVPAIILWGTQMKTQTKLQVFGLLSFASVASIITMVRIPYVNHFKAQTNLQFWVAHTVLCSNVETGIGCIASSVPSLRRFIARTRGTTDNSTPSKSNNTKTGLFTFGSKPIDARSRDRFRNPTDVGFSLATVHGRGDESWERLQDGDSDRGDLLASDHKGGIHAQYTYQVDIETTGTSPNNRPGPTETAGR
ncbi:Satratoxin biosynthesis SC1 cluster protein 4 [Colletotrichum orbiculare MAFF 240422]|uniref:Satratoxin biosynthesis SC1 cluster protein 4 n=2 Tax=Colletotrichum orbiculare species complex TaxID=2707354 RepID=N4VQD8_COLOR|nr:Satratoxin biosynthesis SC1 cluster protein 4 [Colletotrichum orbiculare MAFF 240422]TDZ36718.1 Satratoxin biosynthesis SC1 cluster protein 4 [Colletotrichum spinosum]